jgi:preprotein translocase subunit SecA
MIRDDKGDLVYLSKEEKYQAVVEDIKDCVKRQQPVLVGTTSIENSEIISNYLIKSGVQHEVLNAKQHEREAHIIENAGMPGAVTIATNMAGRGTDIVLGGNLDAELKALGDEATEAEQDKVSAQWQARHQEVLASGGLHVVGSERHESRRIDNQLRGRFGRQGDPGSTRFYLSLEDDLMRIFASERVAKLMRSLGMDEGEAIEHQWVTRAIENAQTKVEGRNFDVRKEILAYDDVANDQRKVIYAHRNDLMAADDIHDMISELRYDVVNDVITKYIPAKTMEEQWDIQGLEEHLSAEYILELPLQDMLDKDRSFQESDLRKTVLEALEKSSEDTELTSAPDVMRHFEKSIMLQVLDNSWKEHLAAMDALRQVIHFRGYAQKDPKQEFKREAFDMFSNLLDHIKYEVIGVLAKVQVAREKDVEAIDEQMQTPHEMQFNHAEADSAMKQPEPVPAAPKPLADKAEESPVQPFVRGSEKVGRNDPCPCGSKKKYKQCHGKLN